jgi:hypothetical protein
MAEYAYVMVPLGKAHRPTSLPPPPFPTPTHI